MGSYANLFDSCGKGSVSFELTTYKKKTKSKSHYALVESQSVGGTFLRAQASGGKGAPLYLTSIRFP